MRVRRGEVMYFFKDVAWLCVSAVDEVCEIHSPGALGFDFYDFDGVLAADDIEVLVEGSGWQVLRV